MTSTRQTSGMKYATTAEELPAVLRAYRIEKQSKQKKAAIREVLKGLTLFAIGFAFLIALS